MRRLGASHSVIQRSCVVFYCVVTLVERLTCSLAANALARHVLLFEPSKAHTALTNHLHHHEMWENDIKAQLHRWMALIVAAAGGAGAMGMM